MTGVACRAAWWLMKQSMRLPTSTYKWRFGPYMVSSAVFDWLDARERAQR